ncbi:MAG: alanine/glycine:cation symporter family protein [Candidatus Cryptobacteroides sp.]|nr:alanine/glycine:cation symporter family protein [Candidatus Cryptobacteroides sp.]
MERIVSAINYVVWSPALVVLLVGAGLYFSIRTRFVQLRRIGVMAHLLFGKKDKPKEKKGVSSFEAFCIALSGRVGTGNIVGVATAIALGGPGAIFWMWVIAFLGASTAFVESTLAQLFNFEHEDGFRGGPACYIDKGLRSKWLAVVFALFTIIGCGLMLTTVQANGMSSAASNSLGIKPLVSGLFLAFLIGLVVIGGIKRISKVASIVTPFMAVAYIVIALVVLAFNWRAIPGLLSMIVTNAFGINPVCGGILGSTIMMGVKRGLFSNEAGQGTGAIPSASADVKHPAEQGLVQAFSVYVDTLLVCTATALMILSAGTYNILGPDSSMLVANSPELGANYVGFTQAAIDTVLGGFGSIFISIALAFFVFTTIMAYYFYSESSIIYLCSLNGKCSLRTEMLLIRVLQIAQLTAIVFGAVKEANLVWTLGDIGVGLMAWVNVIAIILLSNKAFGALKEYEGSISKKK